MPHVSHLSETGEISTPACVHAAAATTSLCPAFFFRALHHMMRCRDPSLRTGSGDAVDHRLRANSALPRLMGPRVSVVPRSTTTSISVAMVMTVVLLLWNTTPVQADVLSATPATISGATFEGIIPTGAAPRGVSPEVFFDAGSGTYYLYPTWLTPKVYSSKDGITWQEIANASMPSGMDWSIVTLDDGTYRMYLAQSRPGQESNASCSQSRKALVHATSTDLIRWTLQPGELFDDVGCGVPHVLRTSRGDYLLYYNTITDKHGVHIATSSDGLVWQKRSGQVADYEYLADPAPIEMPDGTFLMVASSSLGPSGPAFPGVTQKLILLSSPDGLTWSRNPTAVYGIPGYSVFDPAVKLVNGVLRVWYGYSQGLDTDTSYITTGVLKLGGGLEAPTLRAPGPVRNLRVSALKGAVSVKWQAPADLGNAPDVTYEYQVRAGAWVQTDRTSVTIKRNAKKPITVSVRARNAAGPGAASRVRFPVAQGSP
jgi:hypothetical protein